MTGRCAGCGLTDSPKKVRLHVMTCPDYLALHHSEPGRALDPEAEYERHRTEDNTSEARAERRDLKLRTRFAETQRRQSAQADRFRRPRDILAD